MSVLAQTSGLMSAASFLEWSEQQGDDLRYELLDGLAYAMSPERVIHVRTKYAVMRQLESGIASSNIRCEAFIDGMAVQIEENTVFEPDVLVRCGPPLPDDAVLILDPVIVVEVASPSTQRVDALMKLSRYFRNAHIKHYLIVIPGTRTVLHHRRDEGEHIVTTIWTKGVLRLDPPGVVLNVEALFSPAVEGGD